MINLHNNDRSNKSSILPEKFCHPRLSALVLGLYTCTNSVNSEFKAALLKLIADDQCDNSFL